MSVKKQLDGYNEHKNADGILYKGKMRDPDRMFDFLEKVKTEWSKSPDLRFGQLLVGFFAKAGDPFCWEEDKFVEKLQEYMESSPAYDILGMKIEVESQKSLVWRAGKRPFPEKTVLISISDFPDDTLRLENYPEEILYFSFRDASYPGLHRYPGEIFTKDMAKKMAQYIHENKDNIDLLICQCGAGRSRSAAIAAAISQHLHKNGIEFFANPKYCPNQFVYNTLFEELTAL